MSIADRFRNRPQVGDIMDWVWKKFCRFYPIPLVALLVIYVVLGAAGFLCFESDHQENVVRKWHLNQAVNRRQQARQISTRIFNDTKNLLIIIDRDQTERVQGLLVNSLSQYEGHLDLHIPKRDEWDFLHSVNYAWSLLLTIGHGLKGPQTTGGQVLAFFYCIFGVPFFFGTIAIFVHELLLPLVRVDQTKKKIALVLLAALLYVIWILLIAVYLHSYALPKSFWESLYTATMSALTIQTPYFNKLPQYPAFAVLAGSTVSVVLALFVLLLIAGVYGEKSCHNRPVKMRDEAESPKSNDLPKFTVIVDEAGDSKLADMDDE
ncbi:hypothetical protein QR680_000723 [Steinernema hermaphroditum]|uniref:Potassium channel domain-containing protein n=1 Tax=Steinernema hermaphroditum TaxID=289476 RepID=A0AA39GVP4_9BILA|nr:hypothetical protein QR680_000723 [Steinernema hermaphroditum]